ncbi:MAG TPA: orotate phosphoribosyltransferase [Lutibacter sp.]|nr:orotate phosphoribosyltransferase [Lutibacter sp.]
MICNKDTAKKTAKLLLEIEAIKLQPNQPFTWASGWLSPIYCDNRISLSHPKVRDYIRDRFVENIQKNYPDVEVIAGVATGAIAIGVLIAEALELPFIYVRPEPKKHGRQNQIEGYLEKGKKVLVIEDLISTGKSSINAVKALQNAEATILGMYAIFSYDFTTAKELFDKENIRLITLSDYPSLLIQAKESGTISDLESAVLKLWRKDPNSWKVN